MVIMAGVTAAIYGVAGPGYGAPGPRTHQT